MKRILMGVVALGIAAGSGGSAAQTRGEGEVLIYGDAANAAVFVDGVRRGQMPVSAANGFRLMLPVGEHTIELRRDARNVLYEFVSRITVAIKDEALLPLLMAPLAPAALPAAADRVEAVLREFMEGMVPIPAGVFLMGGRDEENSADSEFPRHRVEIPRPFLLQKYGVTFEMWDACVADGGCAHVADDTGLARGGREVFNIDWDDSQTFVRWLSRRLGRQCRVPSEAEWEYAARGGTQTTWSFGDTPIRLGDYIAPGAHLPTIVQPKLPNGYGVYGMAGGSTEWVADCWHTSYEGAPADGSAWDEPNCKARVVRGGFWDASPWYMRPARRSAMNPRNRYVYVGLRLACAADR